MPPLDGAALTKGGSILQWPRVQWPQMSEIPVGCATIKWSQKPQLLSAFWNFYYVKSTHLYWQCTYFAKTISGTRAMFAVLYPSLIGYEYTVRCSSSIQEIIPTFWNAGFLSNPQLEITHIQDCWLRNFVWWWCITPGVTCIFWFCIWYVFVSVNCISPIPEEHFLNLSSFILSSLLPCAAAETPVVAGKQRRHWKASLPLSSRLHWSIFWPSPPRSSSLPPRQPRSVIDTSAQLQNQLLLDQPMPTWRPLEVVRFRYSNSR